LAEYHSAVLIKRVLLRDLGIGVVPLRSHFLLKPILAATLSREPILALER
jgi:hypothetical protein